jgi:hypothetical protein
MNTVALMLAALEQDDASYQTGRFPVTLKVGKPQAMNMTRSLTWFLCKRILSLIILNLFTFHKRVRL